tara:strand:+ start:199 stop:729 length:531 start_codon:yes stop_codon:yes gene_type:complete
MKKRKRRKYTPLPPLEKLKEYLDYNPDTGILTWIKRPTNSVKVGQEAGSKNSKGYITITFKGEKYLAHRIAYYMYHGVDPLEKLVDHKEEPKTNNKINNLRLASSSENGMNRVNLASNNTSGVTGVSWAKDIKKWLSMICLDGVNKNLGYFTNKEDAIQARKEAEKKYFGRFRRKD